MTDPDLGERVYAEMFPRDGQVMRDEISAISVEVEDGLILEAVAFMSEGHTVLRMFPRPPEPQLTLDDAADIGFAWLEATWLRRNHDGLTAIADDDGALGYAFVIPWNSASPKRIEAAIDMLLTFARASLQPALASEPLPTGEESVWIRI
jgi:hypothetical protein